MHTASRSKNDSLSALQEVHDLIADNCLDCVALRATRIALGKNPVMRSDRRHAFRALLLAMMHHLETDEVTHEIVLACSINQWGKDAGLTTRTTYSAADALAEVGWIEISNSTTSKPQFAQLRVVVTQSLWTQLAVKRPVLNRLLRENKRRHEHDHSPSVVLAANLARAKQRLAEGNEPARW